MSEVLPRALRVVVYDDQAQYITKYHGNGLLATLARFDRATLELLSGSATDRAFVPFGTDDPETLLQHCRTGQMDVVLFDLHVKSRIVHDHETLSRVSELETAILLHSQYGSPALLRSLLRMPNVRSFVGKGEDPRKLAEAIVDAWRNDPAKRELTVDPEMLDRLNLWDELVEACEKNKRKGDASRIPVPELLDAWRQGLKASDIARALNEHDPTLDIDTKDVYHKLQTIKRTVARILDERPSAGDTPTEHEVLVDLLPKGGDATPFGRFLRRKRQRPGRSSEA